MQQFSSFSTSSTLPSATVGGSSVLQQQQQLQDPSNVPSWATPLSGPPPGVVVPLSGRSGGIDTHSSVDAISCPPVHMIHLYVLNCPAQGHPRGSLSAEANHPLAELPSAEEGPP